MDEDQKGECMNHKTAQKRTLAFRLVLLALLVVMAVFPARAHAGKGKSYTIYVNRKSNLVNVVDSHKRLVKAMYCSTGKNYSTIKGSYRTQSKMRWHVLYHGVYGQYCTRIHGPYLFHSVPYTRVKKNAVQTREFNKLGRQASHGCIRLSVADAKWIYKNCPVGTRVVIGEKNKLKAPDQARLTISTKKKTGWDPTDPDKRNPYKVEISLKEAYRQGVPLGTDFNLIQALDFRSVFTSSDQLAAGAKTAGLVDTSVPGTYPVKVAVRDPATRLITVEVLKIQVLAP